MINSGTLGVKRESVRGKNDSDSASGSASRRAAPVIEVRDPRARAQPEARPRTKADRASSTASHTGEVAAAPVPTRAPESTRLRAGARTDETSAVSSANARASSGGATADGPAAQEAPAAVGVGAQEVPEGGRVPAGVAVVAPALARSSCFW